MIYVELGRETIGTLTSAIGFTASNIAPTANPPPTYAVIQAIGDAVRYCTGGATPVAATTGFRLPEDAMIEIWGATAMSNFLVVEEATAELEVIYMGTGV